MPGAHTERVWSAEWSAPSALYPRSYVCARPELDGIPVTCENRLDLGARQEMHLSLVVALPRNGEHALDQRTVCRLLEGHEPEEGSESQTQVTRLRAGAALYLEIG